MSGRPRLWCCLGCGRPLGRIVDGELDMFAPGRTNGDEVIVCCPWCRETRTWRRQVETRVTR